jgi:hypothetical protein
MKILLKLLIIALILPVIFSCVGLKPVSSAPAAPPERVEAPYLPVKGFYIMGEGKVDKERLAFFLIQSNPFIELDYVLSLAGFYIEEAAAEGVNHDVAFSQMCLETGFLSYGGLVTPDMNNFCGLGSTGLPDANGLPERGHNFPEPQIGVRAHIQHLKAYATADPLNQTLVDPRYKYVRLGSSPTVDGLAGTWAIDRQYAVKIGGILQRLYEFAL